MKISGLKFILLPAMCFLLTKSIAQNPLQGKWILSCPAVSNASEDISVFCSLCPMTFDKQMETFSVGDLEMEIEGSKMTLTSANESKTINYSWNKEQELLEFNYKNVSYKFKLRKSKDPDHLTLIEANNRIVELSKTK